MKFDETQPLFNARLSDDPYFRIRMQAEARALRNGMDPAAAGRRAMALLKMEPDASPEIVLCTVAGEYRRAA